MQRYKSQDRHCLLSPEVLCEQIVPGSFAFALRYLVEHETAGGGSEGEAWSHPRPRNLA